MSRRPSVALAATAILAVALTACGGQSAPTTTQPAPATTAGGPTTAAGATTATSKPATTTATTTAPKGGDAGGLKGVAGSFATVKFPETLGTTKLSRAGGEGILKTGNYADVESGLMVSVAVNSGQLENVAGEVKALSGAVTSPDGTFVCGIPTGGKSNPNCVAHLSDALVRFRTYGKDITAQEAATLMAAWVKAQQ